jgi:hypothetical protein
MTVSPARPRSTRRPRLGALALAALGAMGMLAACDGDDDDDVATDTTPTSAGSTTTTGASASSAPASTSTTTAAGDTTPATVPGELPGEPADFGPVAGAVLGVVGVAHDDTLNVRAAPGTDQEVVAELEPLADHVVAVGNTRTLPESIWYEIEVDGGTGWVSASFVAYLGATTDVTAAIIEELGATPGAETMVDLADAVAAPLTSHDEPVPEVTVVVAPTVGDLGEITIDVTGYPDDAVLGERLAIFGTPAEGGEGFVLRSVESRVLCHRGVDADGLCV